MNKISRTKQALLDRLDEALSNMYHNAKLHIPMSIDDPDGKFFSFLMDQGELELEYIRDGLGCDDKYWQKQAKLGFSSPNERNAWLVSRIVEYGKIYSWGRGGATLAPINLIIQRGGGSFRIKDSSYFEDMSNEDLTDMIQVLEAFNSYIEDWNSSESIRALYDQFLEYEAENAIEEDDLCPTCGK